jgi:hypothetical protein
MRGPAHRRPRRSADGSRNSNENCCAKTARWAKLQLCWFCQKKSRRSTAGARTQQSHDEIETEHPGYLGCQNTYYVGSIKGVGRTYQQTFIDSYCKTAIVKLYDRKHAITEADMLNDRVLPWYEEHGVLLLRILSDRGSEYCANREHHEFALYLDLDGIEYSRTKAKSPQTNGICERFHQTIENEFYASAFRRKLYTSLQQLQDDVDEWVRLYNKQCSHSGKHCFGKT